ncbi:MAG: YraN family protein [Anaerolineae bacterium]|nr:YraN family protein [Anaerolineae bacterium]
MADRRIQLGRKGEQIIAAALHGRHFTIIDHNWRCPFGEVDLVAERNGEWYFVEVRTRREPALISPEQGLTAQKRRRMEKVARSYVGQHARDEEVIWHLSFAAVIIDRDGHIKRLTFYPDLAGDGLQLII